MNTKNLKLFEKFYNDEMEPEEKVLFEKQLSLDPLLNADFKEYLSVYEAISDYDTLDLRMKLREIREEIASKKNSGDFFTYSYNWLWMAALLTIIISFTVIITLLINQSRVNNQAVAEYYLAENRRSSALDHELMKYEQRFLDFKNESPGEGLFHNMKDPLIFKWTVNSNDPLILDMIDLDGKIVFSSGTSVESPYIISKKLPGGIMVYRFRTNKEAYYIGLLFLR